LNHKLEVELDFSDKEGTNLHWMLQVEPLDINNPVAASWVYVRNANGKIMFEASKDEIVRLAKIVQILDATTRQLLEMEEMEKL